MSPPPDLSTRGRVELPPSRRLLAGLAALAVAGAVVAALGLAFDSSGGDLADAVYVAGLAGAVLTAGVLVHVAESRRQAVAQAKERAHALAAIATRTKEPLLLDPAEMEEAAFALVLLEEARDHVHAQLLSRSLGIPVHPLGGRIGLAEARLAIGRREVPSKHKREQLLPEVRKPPKDAE